MLDRLPSELLLLILDQIDDAGNLNSVVRVCTRLHQLAIPILYRSLTFNATDEFRLWDLGIDSFLESSSAYLKYTRGLRISGSFQTHLSNRCGAGKEIGDENLIFFCQTESTLHAHDGFLESLGSALMPLLSSLPFGNFRSFNWTLGACMPGGITEYLCNRQPQLESLQIVTDITCRYASSLRSRHFEPTNQLRYFSFTPHCFDEKITAGEIIRQNSKTLQEVEIDFITPCHTEHFQLSQENQFVHRILSTTPGNPCFSLSSLCALSLSGVSLEYGIGDIVKIFTVVNLKSLKLRDCWRTNQVLDLLSEARPPAQLVSFELIYSGHYAEQQNAEPLKRFLWSFEGLENLFILHALSDATIGGSFSRHSSTLQRLVYHHNTPYEDEPLLRTVFQWPRLRSLAICYDPVSLTSFFKRTSLRPKLQILHLRSWHGFRDLYTGQAPDIFPKTLSAVFKFADWVFGPDGLDDLQVLAFGDLSFGGRHPSLLLCRDPQFEKITTKDSRRSRVMMPRQRFCKLTPRNPRLWKMVRDNAQFLEACSQDVLLHQ